MIGRTKEIVARNPAEIARAIGLTGADSEEWQVQYELLKRLRQIVREDGLTHAEVARRGELSRTHVTAILNGNLVDVSSDLLIRLLRALGYSVRVSVCKTPV
jgi:predicted XRE-type DNA-binding protein